MVLDPERVLAAFREALETLTQVIPDRDIRPRTVALRAHEIYCANLIPGERRPSFATFRNYISAKSPVPEVLDLLQKADVRPAAHARLDRRQLRAAFQEAIQRLEARILRGRAKPLQIARRAHEIYLRDIGGGAPRPSPYTFRRLIYGKAADLDILSLME